MQQQYQQQQKQQLQQQQLQQKLQKSLITEHQTLHTTSKSNLILLSTSLYNAETIPEVNTEKDPEETKTAATAAVEPHKGNGSIFKDKRSNSKYFNSFKKNNLSSGQEENKIYDDSEPSINVTKAENQIDTSDSDSAPEESNFYVDFNSDSLKNKVNDFKNDKTFQDGNFFWDISNLFYPFPKVNHKIK